MYNTTPMLLLSEYTPTVTEQRYPAQEHTQHHSYIPKTSKYSYNHRTQKSCSGACTTSLLHSYIQKTLIQSQNIDTLPRSTHNTIPMLLQSENTPTIPQHRYPTHEYVQHHSYTPVIRKHSYNHRTQTPCSEAHTITFL